MSQPRRILIVTPTLNSARYLEETVLSVATQRGDLVIHYHVQDGVSTDGTLEILRKWEGVFADSPSFLGGAPVCFSWSSEKDRSMYDSLNKGFDHLLSVVPASEVVLMTWINSDDRLASDSMQTVLCAHLATGYEAITGLPSIILDSGVKAWTSPYRPVARENIRAGLHDGRTLRFIMQEGTYWTPALWRKSGGLNGSLRLAGDWDLWRRFAEHADWLGLMAVLAYHRRHASQLSHDMEKYWAEVDRVKVDSRIENCLPDAGATGNKCWFNSNTNVWEILQEPAGVYSSKEKQKDQAAGGPVKISSLAEEAAAGWQVRFSLLGYPIADVIGLSYTETWGRWSDANLYDRVILKLSVELPSSFELSFTAAAYCGKETFLEVAVVVGDTQQVVRLGWKPELYTVVFKDARPSRFITFIPKNPVSPSEIKPGGDTRKIGIGFRSLGFRPVGPPPVH